MTDLTVLEEILNVNYGLAVAGIVQFKSVLGIVSKDNSRWIWKPAQPRDSEVRLRALNGVTQHLERAGVHIAGPIPARRGRYLTRTSETEAGYLQPWIDGRHADFSNEEERLNVVAALASMHKHSMSCPPDWLEFLRTGSLMQRFLRKEQALIRAWPLALTNLPELKDIQEELWFSVERVVKKLKRRTLPEVLCFSHRDLAAHNILWNSGRKSSVCFIDLDQSGFDRPILDILQICNHSLHCSEAAEGHFQRIVRTYQDYAPLSPEIEWWIWKLLVFPDLLVRSILEWVQDGCPEQGRYRVLLSARRARTRWKLLQTEGPGRTAS